LEDQEEECGILASQSFLKKLNGVVIDYGRRCFVQNSLYTLFELVTDITEGERRGYFPRMMMIFSKDICKTPLAVGSYGQLGDCETV
jgi:hypothetical protein